MFTRITRTLLLALTLSLLAGTVAAHGLDGPIVGDAPATDGEAGGVGGAAGAPDGETTTTAAGEIETKERRGILGLIDKLFGGSKSGPGGGDIIDVTPTGTETLQEKCARFGQVLNEMSLDDDLDPDLQNLYDQYYAWFVANC